MYYLYYNFCRIAIQKYKKINAYQINDKHYYIIENVYRKDRR